MTDKTQKLGAIKERVGSHWAITGQCGKCGVGIQRMTDDPVVATAAKASMARGSMRCDRCERGSK